MYRYKIRTNIVAQSLSKILIHIVFSTKDRHSFITKELQPGLYAYMSGVCKTLDSHCYRIGGVEDHIHIACTLPRTITISKLVSEIKSASSK